jgi:nitroreductase
MYLYQDSSLSEWSLFDLGLFAQTLMLAAHAKGIGTVPQGFATDYAQQVKEYLGIPADKRLVLGISMGYPDMTAPVNDYRTERSPAEEIATFTE